MPRHFHTTWAGDQTGNKALFISIMKASNIKQTAVRAACDKCHSIKIRCSRDAGSLECQRCVRLGFKCSYSAPLQMGRPRHNSRLASASGSKSDRKSLGRSTPGGGSAVPSGMAQDHLADSSTAFYPAPTVEAPEYTEGLAFDLGLDGADKNLTVHSLLREPHGPPFDDLFMRHDGRADRAMDFMGLADTDSIDPSLFSGTTLSESGHSRDDRDEELAERLSSLQVKLQQLHHRIKQDAFRDNFNASQKVHVEQESAPSNTDLNDIFMATVDFTDVLHDHSGSRPQEWSMDHAVKCQLLSCYLSLVDVYDASSEQIQRAAANSKERPTWSGTGTVCDDNQSGSSPASGLSTRSSSTGSELYLHLLSQMRIRAKQALDKYR